MRDILAITPAGSGQVSEKSHPYGSDAVLTRKDPVVLLDVRTVTKRYPGTGSARPVLDSVSLQLDKSETLALTGESGSGKSTLLHLAGALDTFDNGEIFLGGVALSGLDDTERAAIRRSEVALVFQQFNLIPSLNLAQNLAFHARLAGRNDADHLAELIARLGLAGLEDRFPENLSGGQQQRVAIGRALALRPKLLLADEPTGNLDENSSDAVLSLMLDLVRESGTALFLVTHSRQIAARLDHHLHLSNGQVG